MMNNSDHVKGWASSPNPRPANVSVPTPIHPHGLVVSALFLPLQKIAFFFSCEFPAETKSRKRKDTRIRGYAEPADSPPSSTPSLWAVPVAQSSSRQQTFWKIIQKFHRKNLK